VQGHADDRTNLTFSVMAQPESRSRGVIPKPRVFASGARACPEGLTATPEGAEWESCVQPAG